jgi:hypothetical protein
VQQNQIEFVVMSALRCSWNMKEAFSPSKPAIANGMLTTIAVPSTTAPTRSAPRQSGAGRPASSRPPRPPVKT